MVGQVLRRTAQSGLYEGHSSGSVPCIAAEDVDAVLASAEQQGGQAHGAAFYLPGVGRFGLMTDSAGKLIAVRERDERS